MIKSYGKFIEFDKNYNLDSISLDGKLTLARHTVFVNMNMDFIYDYSIEDSFILFDIWNNKRIKITHRLESDYYHNFMDNDINLEDETLLKISQHNSSLAYGSKFQLIKKLSYYSHDKSNISLGRKSK